MILNTTNFESLGDVMKESAQLALSWLRSRSVEVNGPWYALTVDNKGSDSFLLKINT